jgi:hypothetical protein
VRLKVGTTGRRITGVVILLLFLVGTFDEGFAAWVPSSRAKHSTTISESSRLARVWALGDSEKVRKFDLNHPLAQNESNAVWDGERISLIAARNEVVAFQLILQSDRSGADGVDVFISDLSNGNSRILNSLAGSNDPYNYLGRNIELFTEHYLEIVDPSRGGSSWSKNASPGSSYIGWVPDALIPFSASPGKGGAPFNISPSANQGVWVDIWVPDDSPAGVYQGEVLVKENGSISRRIPLDLLVYDFSLSDETHFPNMFAIEAGDIASRHGVVFDTDEYYDIETRYHQMAHRHRFDLVQPVRNLSQMRRYHSRYLTGSLYTSKFNYAGPGEGVGNNTFSIGLYGNLPTEYGGDPQNWSKEMWWQGSDAWARWFNDVAPQVSIHKFLLPDEPQGDTDLRAVRAQANWSHSNPGFGASIATFVTHWIDPDYAGYVDTWSISANHILSGTTPGTQARDVFTELDSGNSVGVYNGYRPATGSTLIDTDATDFRVLPWIGWKYDLDHYFYWMTNYWSDWMSDGKKWNVFTNPRTTGFQRNGAGTFFYPGQDMVYQEEDRGLEGPIASIRMKNWRRGMQDYEYLWLAQQLGLDHEVTNIVDRIVPAALWDTSPGNDIAWPRSGFDFEITRKAIADLIADRLQEPELLPRDDLVEFVDVSADHPYIEPIHVLYQDGYLGGCSQDPAMFCPDRVLTRAEASILFGRFIFGPDNSPAMPGNQLFLDLPLSGGFSWSVPWATGLIEAGYDVSCSTIPSLFCPEKEISRLDAVIVMLQARYGTNYIPPQPEGLFSDISLHWWGSGWMEAAYRLDILEPCQDQPRLRSCPFGDLTRGEAASMVVRALN